MRKLTFALAALLFISSCKKKNDAPAVTVENIAGNYALESITVQSGSSPAQDVTSQMKACERDDRTILNANKTVTYVDAGVKCSPPGDATGTWDVPNPTTFVLDGDSYTLVKFDGSLLQISETETFMGQTVIYTISMRK